MYVSVYIDRYVIKNIVKILIVESTCVNMVFTMKLFQFFSIFEHFLNKMSKWVPL